MNLDIVISLYDEKNINWILDIPEEYNIYIYNKGTDLSEDFIFSMKFKNLKFKIEKLKNVGRESDTYLHHIIKNYNNLADLTIFSQAEPHIHSPDFSKLLENYKDFQDFECLTDRGLTDMNLPPLEYLEEKYVKNKHLNNYRCAGILFNLNNLFPVFYKDIIVLAMVNQAMTILGIIPKENNKTFKKFCHEVSETSQTHKSLIEIFLEKCDISLKYNKSEFPAIYYHCIGACFAVRKNRILQNSLESYKKLKKINLKDQVFGYLIEKSWAILFGPVYNKQMLLEDLKINNLE